MNSSKETKDGIRKIMANTIKDIPLENKLKQAKEVSKQLIQHATLKQAKVICLYRSLSNEISFDEAIQHRIKENKTLVYPVYTKDSIPMVSVDGVAKYMRAIDVCILPGRAFTNTGARLGRGGGRYDRFLVDYQETYKIGICYSQQIVDTIPQEDHDICMDEIIYETLEPRI